MYVEKNKLKIELKIIENDNEIQRRLLKFLLPQVKKFMNGAINTIKNRLPVVVNEAIKRTPEYNNLIGGRLQYEFGIPDPNIKLAGLLNIWSKNIEIEYNNPQIVSNQIKSFFSASLIRVDFSDVLYTDYAQVFDYNRGYSLPWLQWLLLEGRKTLVKNYEVVIGPNSRSRSGFAIMAESKKSWKVPGEFAGTISDNWITRAIDSAQNDIQKVIQESIK